MGIVCIMVFLYKLLVCGGFLMRFIAFLKLFLVLKRVMRMF